VRLVVDGCERGSLRRISSCLFFRVMLRRGIGVSLVCYLDSVLVVFFWAI
jgi:hypothetical protein